MGPAFAGHAVRNDCDREEIAALCSTSRSTDLVFSGRHRPPANHTPGQVATLGPCSRSKPAVAGRIAGYLQPSPLAQIRAEAEKLLGVRTVLPITAGPAKDRGFSRFCMGAALAQFPRTADMPAIIEMVQGVRQMAWKPAHGRSHADQEAVRNAVRGGLDYYNPQYRHLARTL